ncbi:hypothetical protein VTN31DRAFT_3551 [Thermomyces dupontii]|uniref:uncharacterized protein n=1 Tax=Talaromyces thermophilus TaxID=28565 RepID=UPI00374402E2
MKRWIYSHSHHCQESFRETDESITVELRTQAWNATSMQFPERIPIACEPHQENHATPWNRPFFVSSYDSSFGHQRSVTMRNAFSTLEWSLEWALSLGCDTGQMASLTIVPVKQSRVSGDAVLSELVECSVASGWRETKSEETYIPNHDGSRGPFHASLNVLRQGHVIEEEFQQVV